MYIGLDPKGGGYCTLTGPEGGGYCTWDCTPRVLGKNKPHKKGVYLMSELSNDTGFNILAKTSGESANVLQR